MKKSEVWALSQPTRDSISVFRAILGKVKDLNLNLAIIANDKKLKDEGDLIREVLKNKEPKQLEEIRTKLKAAGENKELTAELVQKLNSKYNAFIEEKEIQEFLKGESDIELKKCTLSKKYVEGTGFDTDQVELLLMFTNIGELGEEEKEEKQVRGKKHSPKNVA